MKHHVIQTNDAENPGVIYDTLQECVDNEYQHYEIQRHYMNVKDTPGPLKKVEGFFLLS
jgi:hypothetical protein